MYENLHTVVILVASEFVLLLLYFFNVQIDEVFSPRLKFFGRVVFYYILVKSKCRQ